MMLRLLPLLLVAGCAAQERPFAPVEMPDYMAMGEQPFWTLAIGDDRIVLSRAADGQLVSAEYPRVLPRTVDHVRIWESAASDTAVIAIEARPGPCESNGRRFTDTVRVRLSGSELNGCGGRLLEGARG